MGQCERFVNSHLARVQECQIEKKGDDKVNACPGRGTRHEQETRQGSCSPGIDFAGAESKTKGPRYIRIIARCTVLSRIR